MYLSMSNASNSSSLENFFFLSMLVQNSTTSSNFVISADVDIVNSLILVAIVKRRGKTRATAQYMDISCVKSKQESGERTETETTKDSAACGMRVGFLLVLAVYTILRTNPKNGPFYNRMGRVFETWPEFHT